MKKHLHVIQSIVPGSIAEEMELQPGDTVLAINGQDIEDVFDYHYLVNDEYIEMLIRTADGTEEVLEIEKDYDEDIGIVFESSLMDDYRSCSNNCIFCFIDQLPKGMRETMYFKDDDSRLSFLQGNYITMTNMKDEALERIIRYKLEPINVSVHTTNPELLASSPALFFPSTKIFGIFPTSSNPLLISAGTTFIMDMFLILAPFGIVVMRPTELSITGFVISENPKSFKISTSSGYS